MLQAYFDNSLLMDGTGKCRLPYSSLALVRREFCQTREERNTLGSAHAQIVVGRRRERCKMADLSLIY
jgi:hypothetical protein